MQAYLFVHFKEKTTPDGEQVYFALSIDGFRWEAVNDGVPVLWAFYGDKGVRDFTVVRCEETQKFYIVATDLSLAYGLRNQYHNSWAEIARNGSKCFSVWESEDLVNWSEQRLLKLGTDDFGCLWAPDIIFDKTKGDYVIHWSSSHKINNFGTKGIFYSRTKDFEHFSAPKELFRKEDSGVIDSAIYEENGKYYMFVKSECNPSKIMLWAAERIEGPYTPSEAFNDSMSSLEAAKYEAPTAVRLPDGKWLLFLDYYGARGGAQQGYIESLAEGKFTLADELCEFPYKFKHGTVLAITYDEYERIKNHDWSDKGYQ